ncbi:hypothetical protein CSW27_09110 [Thermus scotoductus]|uniref:Uncharacterized protein n=1 Tax=Thermus scotoductus TaxID=37636 RepID=A0A430UVK1_THESC|nr:hypothetical protein CSW27_09110 [Thermus scotoductus]
MTLGLLILLLVIGLAWTLRKRSSLSPSPLRCSRCGMPHRLALQVKEYKRHCPYVAYGQCPYDPRRGIYRLRR